MINLVLETTTGRIVPAGVAPTLPRGAAKVTLQLLTAGVATLLGDGAPLALKLFAPGDTDTVLANFNAWTPNAGFKLYEATVNPLSAAALAWTSQRTFLARIDYGDPNILSALFHVLLGGGGVQVAGPVPQQIITQPAGPVDYMQLIGYFQGKVLAEQVEGRWFAPKAVLIHGLDLHAQVMPEGDDLVIEAVVDGAPTGKTAALTDSQKSEYTAFANPLMVDAGSVVQFKATQVGSGKPGSYLTVHARVEIVS